MKKLLALLLVAMLAFAAAACGENDDSSKKSSSENDIVQKLTAHTWKAVNFDGGDNYVFEVKINSDGTFTTNSKYVGKYEYETSYSGKWSIDGTTLTGEATSMVESCDGSEVSRDDSFSQQLKLELEKDCTDEMIQERYDAMKEAGRELSSYQKNYTLYVSDKWLVLNGNQLFVPKD